MKQYKLVIAVCLLFTLNVGFADMVISDKDGSVSFSGEHAGMTFSGEFQSWSATIALPPAGGSSPSGSIEASFNLVSAKTGDSIYDETLPEGDWFDVDNYPLGTFISSSVIKTAQGFDVEGILTLRGMSIPTSFTLKEKGERLITSFTINRLDYGIGVESDPEAEWVSKDIQMRLDIPRP